MTAAPAARSQERVLAAVEEAADELVAFAAETVRARSLTGAEGEVAPLYERWLTEHGFAVTVDPVDAAFRDARPSFAGERDLHDRPNVYGWLAEPSGRPVLVLNGHMDVVPAAGWDGDPFGGEVAGGRIRGRGAADMKGGLAAGLFAAHAIRSAGVELRCDVQVQCVIAEETGGLGTLWALAGQPRPAAAIVLEPTDCVVASACGGMQPFEVEVRGRAAHTSVPWTGVSAYEKLATVQAAIAELAHRREAELAHPLFDGLPAKAPLAIGTVTAGDDPRMVPGRATLAGRIGALPGEDLAALRAALADALAGAARQDEWLREHPALLRIPHAGTAAWETPAEEPVVRALRAARREVMGDPGAGAMTFGSDAGHFADAGVPVALFGPGRIADAHTVDETVAISDLIAAARVLALAIVEYSELAGEGKAA